MSTLRHSADSSEDRSAFTLVELLVVVVVIAVLAALTFPVLHMVRKNGDRTAGLSNMRQIGAGFGLYAAENGFQFPSPAQRKFDRWPKLIGKYLNDVRVYAAPGATDNFLQSKTDPLSNGSNNTNYLMNGFNDLGGWDKKGAEIRVSNIEYPATTLLLGMQKPGSHHFYMDFLEPPHGNQKDLLDLKAYGDGSNYLFVDGSARFITEKDYRDDLWLADKTFVIPNM